MTTSIPKVRLEEHRSPEQLLNLYRIKPAHLQLIRESSDVAIPQINEMIDNFYLWMVEHPSMMAFFETEEMLQHVRKMQGLYWQRFMKAEINQAYIDDRRRIGEIHARIGLPVMFYLGAVSMIYSDLGDRSHRIWKEQGKHSDTNHQDELLQSMASLMHMDAGLICQSFVDKRDQLLNEQSQAVMAMSTPVTEIWDGILLLPIVGIVDSKRSEDIMNAVLIAIKTSKAKEFILDISGVGVVDTAVANYLISITKATSLMGCRSTVSGISPSISKTIIQLGIEIGEINTTSTMMDALSAAFVNRGIRLKQASAGKKR